MIVTPGEISTQQLHAYLLGSIAPRPICFASTIDEDGQPNLSPFSFFNVFGSKPPTIIFSPARRVRNNTIKHTLENIYATKEVVINIVNYAMVQQQSLASCEYPKGVNEFEKAGFTPIASENIRPFRVAEAPVSLECKVIQVIETGQEGGAGNLIICEVIKMHIKEEILDENGQIDPHKIDLVARMGMDYYCRASGDAVFEVPKPNTALGIGIDALPESIRQSEILTGNDLGQLANVAEVPERDDDFDINQLGINVLNGNKQEFHKVIQALLLQKKLEQAWQVLLYSL